MSATWEGIDTRTRTPGYRGKHRREQHEERHEPTVPLPNLLQPPADADCLDCWAPKGRRCRPDCPNLRDD